MLSPNHLGVRRNLPIFLDITNFTPLISALVALRVRVYTIAVSEIYVSLKTERPFCNPF